MKKIEVNYEPLEIILEVFCWVNLVLLEGGGRTMSNTLCGEYMIGI